MIFDDRNIEQIVSVAESAETSFVRLAHLAGLNPARDFVNADLRGVDFGNDDISGFDFSGADLTDANLAEARGITSAKFSKTTKLPRNFRLPARKIDRPAPGLGAVGAKKLPDLQDRRYHPPEEARTHLISEMRDPKFRRQAVNVARKVALQGMGPEDLVDETIEAVYSGRRRWPVDIEFSAFFYMALQSIGFNSRRHQGMMLELQEDLHDDGEAAMEMEQAVHWQNLLAELERVLSSDEALLRFQQLRLDGYTKLEIMREMAISEEGYSVISSRYRRRLKALIPYFNEFSKRTK